MRLNYLIVVLLLQSGLAAMASPAVADESAQAKSSSARKPRSGLVRPNAKGPPPPYVWAAFVPSGAWR
jgi:hypothetical protein